jgi:hypothetical protein
VQSQKKTHISPLFRMDSQIQIVCSVCYHTSMRFIITTMEMMSVSLLKLRYNEAMTRCTLFHCTTVTVVFAEFMILHPPFHHPERLGTLSTMCIHFPTPTFKKVVTVLR